MALLLALAALLVIVVGAWAALFGHARPAHLYSRGRGLLVAAAGIALFFGAAASLPPAVPRAPSVHDAMATAQANEGQAASLPTSTILDVTGSGLKTTATFTVGDAWDMRWSYDCAASPPDGKGNFIVVVKQPDGRLSSNAGTNQLGTGGGHVEHFHQGGTFYLQIESECGWHVTVRG